MNTKHKFLGALGASLALAALVVLAGPSDPIPLSGYVAVKNGGTGVQTLTGIVRANGTSAFSAATGAQIASAFTGTCNSGTVLFGDGSCAATTGASLSGTNVWTGLNTFQNTSGPLLLQNTSSGTDAKNWLIKNSNLGGTSSSIELTATTDAASTTPVAAGSVLSATRTGTAVTSVNVGPNGSATNIFIGGLLNLTAGGSVTSSLTTGNNNNANPWGASLTSMLRFTTVQASSVLTGLVPPASSGWAVVILCNDTVTTFTIAFGSASSTAANTFLTPGSVDYTMTGNKCVFTMYDRANSRWRIVGA